MTVPAASPVRRAPASAVERPANRAAETALYASPDLHEAARKSQLGASPGGRLAGIRNAAAILACAVGRRSRRRNETRLELVVASGVSPGSGQKLTAAYAGSGENRAWCLSTVFEDYETTCRSNDTKPHELRRLLGEAQRDCDVFFTEGLPQGFVPGACPPLVRMPAWIKQRVRILDSWPLQVDGLRRETRQEIGRILRKYRYEAHLTRRVADHVSFYDALYLPYVMQRFGAAAHVVDRGAFLKECGRGIVLCLTLGDAVLGAALLRPTGSTMAVVWSALDPLTAGQRRGATDALDWFSLLYAHLQGCRWLDLGPSRPDLCDGVLRYKAKWGGRIRAGLLPQPVIGWRCKPSRGGMDFLRRHVFLIRVGRGLRAVVAAEGSDAADALGRKLAAVANAGIRDCRVLALSAPGDGLRDIVEKSAGDVSFVDATGYADLMDAMR